MRLHNDHFLILKFVVFLDNNFISSLSFIFVDLAFRLNEFASSHISFGESSLSSFLNFQEYHLDQCEHQVALQQELMTFETLSWLA